jgi:hypothetical protein
LATLGAQRIAANPDTQFSAVLLLVSSWYGCGGAVNAVTTALSGAWPGVSTYVIEYVNASAGDCDQMAMAGGTFHRLSPAANAALDDELIKAARPCQFELPAGNWTGVALTLHVGNSSTGTPLPERSSGTSCGNNDGWFVSPSSTKTGVLCPSSCYDAIQVSGSVVKYQTSCN